MHLFLCLIYEYSVSKKYFTKKKKSTLYNIYVVLALCIDLYNIILQIPSILLELLRYRKTRFISRGHNSIDDDPTSCWRQKKFNVQPSDERYQLSCMDISH